ncbi:uncharacterized protein SPAPADRAFT_51848 [Spathaspora passalidarum NRRL Y-27907]|uniref:Uncharacterized protein n=1 Tax=Spathaspora passalidarum (strain NRRL Y-27907 / 11-Y1) TaxID=619300 RepID=G3AS34_SPAPN|nr:uncharacterized protein SPAPADRAFT_51848 [Spathaspora passalidarum NRRL Y-27907]EGW31883.1 hypothetical protein SPAPADRAFT_51848 [Spathaspora passalidarum NRRL Y-27907]
MSKKQQLVDLVVSNTAVSREPPVDEIYFNKLQKDIQRVNQFITQADVAINHLQQHEESASIEQKIIAMYDSYERIPYVPDKNDTIGTAATSSILSELIDRNTRELKESAVETEPIELLISEYKQILDFLAKDKQDKQETINRLNSKIEDFQFTPSIKHLLIQAGNLHRDLQRSLKRVITRYLAMSDTGIIDKSQLNQQLKQTTKLINQLLSGDWVDVPEYSHIKFFIDTLVKNDMLLLKYSDSAMVKLRGFDIE